MDELIIKATKSSPGIYISRGVFLFQGRSIVKGNNSFFQPVQNYAKKYIKSPHKTTTIKIMLEYMDAKSSQAILQFLETMLNVDHKKSQLKIIWCYTHGDIEMVELGEILQGRLETEFSFEEFEPIPAPDSLDLTDSDDQ